MKKNEVKIGAILSYIVIFINIFVNLAYTPFLIRKLGQSEYGLYSLVSSIISYLTILDLGFGNAIIVYTARYRARGEKEQEEKLHGMFFIIYTIISMITLVLGIVLLLNVKRIFGETMSAKEIETTTKLMIVLILNLVVTFPLSIFSSIITAYEKFIFSKSLNIIRIVLNPIIMLPLLLRGYKAFALVIVITILNILTLLINAVFCIQKLKIKLKLGKIDFGVFKEIFSYSIWIFLNSIIDKVNWSVDQLILGAVSGTIAVSVYSVAAKINNLYMNFSNAISSVMLPKVTKMETSKASDEEFTNVMIKTGRIQYLVLALIMTGFIIFGRQFIKFWAGTEYKDAYIIGIILMLPITIPLIQNVGLAILQAKNKYKYRTMIFFLIAILNVCISIPLAKKYGGIGSAIGTAIAEILGQCIILNIYYHRNVHINIIKFWKNILIMTVPIGILFIIVYWLNNCVVVSDRIIIFLLKILCYTIVYSIIAWLFVMNDYEKGIVNKILIKLRIKKVCDIND